MHIPARILRRLKQEDDFNSAQERARAERTRKFTQKLVDDYSKSTRTQRSAVAKAQAWTTYAAIREINAGADLALTSAPSVAAGVSVKDIRIDDLDGMFAVRDRLPVWLRERINKAHAKIHWERKSDGKPGYFNVAVHKNGIPLDKALAILCHMYPAKDALGQDIRADIDTVIECGLFARVKQGKFHYGHRCQRGDDCDLCNYLNITDGLKMLKDAYSTRTFNRGGNFFGVTIAPRRNPEDARALGRTLQPDDWDFENQGSVVYTDARQGGAFAYPHPLDEDGDWHIQSGIRRFLGAGQFVLGKLVKNGWLDGVRGRVENRVTFLPYTEHFHWHAVGSSHGTHDPQSMAEFIKERVDEVLAANCRGVYADVLVFRIPTADDLRRWVKYCNKPIDLVGPVASVYNRHPDLRRTDATFKAFMAELNLMPFRQFMLFKLKRMHLLEADEHGAHTYSLKRRYVAGNHKFGKGSVLSESEAHRKWRAKHAANTAERRRQNPAAGYPPCTPNWT